MSATVVTCFLSRPISSNKGQMIRGGINCALPPSTAFFRTTKSPMKVVGATTADLAEPITEVNGPGPDTIGIDKAEKKKSTNMTVVTDDDNQLVVEFHLPGLSKDKIDHELSKNYNYLIIKGKDGRDGVEENPKGSRMWSHEALYDNHFRLPKDWDKNEAIKFAFDEAREVLTVKVLKSKEKPNVGIIWE